MPREVFYIKYFLIHVHVESVEWCQERYVVYFLLFTLGTLVFSTVNVLHFTVASST